MHMFCYQCEQTAKGQGCTAFGVCGKAPETAALQDLLVYAVKDISRYAHGARELGGTDSDERGFRPETLPAILKAGGAGQVKGAKTLRRCVRQIRQKRRAI